MIRLARTSRIPDKTGVTPPFVAGLILFTASLGALYLINATRGTAISPCLFKIVTGEPCFLCGGTRTAEALALGNWGRAFSINPLAAVLVLGVGTVAVLKLGFGRRIELRGPLGDRRFLWMLAITAAAANWIYVIRTL